MFLTPLNTLTKIIILLEFYLQMIYGFLIDVTEDRWRLDAGRLRTNAVGWFNEASAHANESPESIKRQSQLNWWSSANTLRAMTA